MRKNKVESSSLISITVDVDMSNKNLCTLHLYSNIAAHSSAWSENVFVCIVLFASDVPELQASQDWLLCERRLHRTVSKHGSGCQRGQSSARESGTHCKTRLHATMQATWSTIHVHKAPLNIDALCHFVVQLVPYCPPRISNVISDLAVKGVFADGCTTMLSNLWVYVCIYSTVAITLIIVW